MTVSLAAAVQCLQDGDLEGAAKAFDRLIIAEPKNAHVHHLGGIIAMHMDRPELARVRLEAALDFKPQDARIQYDYGAALEALKRIAEAISAYQKAIALPNCPVEAITRLGVLVARFAGAEKAMPILQAAVTHGGATQEVWSVLGRCLCETQQWSEALDAAQNALDLGPSVEAAAVQAWALRVLKQPSAALEALIGAEKEYTDHPEYWHQRALSAAEVGDMPEAYVSFDTAIERAPNGANYAFNKGVAAQKGGDWTKAEHAFEQAIELRPDHAAAHHNLALLYLFSGQTHKAWPHYEYRRKLPDFTGATPELTEWTGQDLSGKSILITFEQGLGDTLQFMRYVPVLLEQTEHVSIYVNPGLEAVVPCLDSRLHLIKDGATLTQEYWCPLQSLPLRLGPVEAPVPYLTPKPEHSAPWHAHLPETSVPRIGLVWAGNPKNKNDHNRSLDLERLAPLLSQKCVQWVSLQMGPSTEALSDAPFEVINPMPHVSHFMDTAGLMQHLDLVITVDTAVVHMAGALGIPTWLLTPARGHWVWGHAGETTSWYPSVRIFRQDAQKGWIIQDIVGALSEWVDQRVGTGSSLE